MRNKIPIFIISLKNSPRLPRLKDRLKELNLGYKIFYGVTGKKLNNRIKLIYDRNLTKKNIDRDLSPSEIGTASSHLGIYNYIINKKINQAIIMEDDAYPSKILKQWITCDVQVENNEILSFYTYPSTSFLTKTPYRKLVKNKIGAHISVTHAYNNSCYQINKYTCKKIILLTKNKVIGYADWPFLINRDKIRLSVTIPFIAVIDDMGISSLRDERKILIKENQFFKKIFSKKILSLLRIPYYLSYMGFLLRYKNKDFYYEHFFQKQLLRLINFFIKKYLETNKIYYDKKYYWYDLRKIVEKFSKNY